MKTQTPTFKYEQQYWQQGIDLIAGVDEVGMGALAGPVCAAAVIFGSGKTQNASPVAKAMGDKEIKRQNIGIPLTRDKIFIRDSKTLSAKQREMAEKWIRENALAWAVGEASVEEITVLNIRRASHLAMRRAVDALSQKPEMLLVDGNPAQPHETVPSVNILDGDALSFSIAAASIVAKVYRDNLMVELDKKYPAYGFAAHKGYGSQFHLGALKEHGACAIHRPTYAPIAKLKRQNESHFAPPKAGLRGTRN
ncbi:MAG: ribonuclease HII [bacterium]|nr:ribonuclease HII [bacterium]